MSDFSYLIGSDGENMIQVFNEFSEHRPLIWLVTPALAHQLVTRTHTD
jgi:hypothetical protein